MIALLIKKEEQGLINLNKIDHFLVPEVKDISQVITYLTKRFLNHFDYKICTFKDIKDIPYFMKIEDDLINQLLYFTFTRVKLKDLEKADQELYIKDHLMKNGELEIKRLEEKGKTLLLYNFFGESNDEKITEIGEKIEKLNSEITNFDISKYLDMEV